ncbi:uncharacterized protein ACA1_202410 [Acanthamoeba castellanii str. Neff]|uniref:Uncharacterized protein n=1 Tax=Acanthamoeba castellanii (strain ATCC 30010 / Neff) TaxID=1257118 RepID=L8GSU0_ACACF|nr:uncharacterized protein ACA1_202410 [Acanthamoeba castellanii str. Neff]ELR16269.1 hypothetical protein ACA1_202410 [Acanthamoeba castellanii str. Neff]
MEPDQLKEEKINLIEEDLDAIPEQKEYSAVAEVLAESIVAAESFWHATVRYLNSFDQRHAVTQRAWEKTAEVGGMAMANPYVASAVTTVTEGVELANTIYAQTLELIQEKRRGLADSFSSSSSTSSSTSADADAESHNSVVVAVHTNDDDLHYEQLQQEEQHEQEQQASTEPEALALDIQVNH